MSEVFVSTDARQDYPRGVLSIATKMVFFGRAKTVPVPLCGESITCRLSAHVDVHVQMMGVIHGNNFTSRRSTAELS